MSRKLQLVTVTALLALAVPALAQQSAAPETETQVLIVDGAAVGAQVAPHAGEICMLCNNPIAENDVTYLVHGQRVPVHRLICNGRLRDNPRAVLASLQPRGAFLGAEKETSALSAG